MGTIGQLWNLPAVGQKIGQLDGQSSADLAADLRRWLSNEPIEARAPGVFYRARLFAKRNKVLVGSALLITVILLATSVVSTSLYIKTLAAQRATQAELVSSEDLANFLTQDLLNMNDAIHTTTAAYQTLVPKLPFNANDAKAHQKVFALQYDASEELVTSTGQRLRLIPLGVFTYTRPANSTVFASLPIEIRLTEAYYCGVGEVTVDQFRQFVDATDHLTGAEFSGQTARREDKEVQGLFWKEPGYSQTDRHPVVMLRRNDARAFCDWLSRKEGKRYRLPTEAEWEYACRAGTNTARYFSRREDIGDYMQVGVNSDNSARPVGLLKPNPWGLYDTLGNLAEWCNDWYGEYPHGLATDPQGPDNGDRGVTRGGHFRWPASGLRSALREASWEKSQSDVIGFRVLLEIDASSVDSGGGNLEE